ncbi:MAG: LacI family DNA-binding transcriptional regulator [Spirochaetales bacterium]|nr:LacI family DNA-binding transcriptional regulator [Spirochaetales bacterium]
MSVLLKDIAEKTGFSINTVSRALRDDKKLSESTRKTIRETAEMMGYVRNSAAALMRKGTSNEIGIISGDSSNPFFAEVVRGIEETAKQAGFRILLLNTDEDPEREADYMKMFVSMKVAGILIVPVFHDDMCQKIYRTISVPYYFVGRHVEGITGHSILHSDIQSQYDVTQSLINKGHRRILYIVGPENISNTIDRLNGYLKALDNNGIPRDPDLIIRTNGHIEDGFASINRALNRSLNFTAVACFNDLVAMGAIKALSENNYRVPEDIEVFGFDNLYISQFMQPSLSTVDVPKFALGKIAIETLLRHIDDPQLPYDDINLNTRLIYRKSSARNRLSLKEGSL